MTRATIRNFPRSFLYSAAEGDESWDSEATQLSPGGHELDVGSLVDGVAELALGDHDSVVFDGPAALSSSPQPSAAELSDHDCNIILDIGLIEDSTHTLSVNTTSCNYLSSRDDADQTPLPSPMVPTSPSPPHSMILSQDLKQKKTSVTAPVKSSSSVTEGIPVVPAFTRSNTSKSRLLTISSSSASSEGKRRDSHIGLHSATVEAIRIAEQDSSSEPESLGEEFVMVANTPQRPHRSTETLYYDNELSQPAPSLSHDVTPLIQASPWVVSATHRARENTKSGSIKRPTLKRMSSSRSTVEFVAGHNRGGSKSTITSTDRTSIDSSSSADTPASSTSPTSAFPEVTSPAPGSTSPGSEARGRSIRRQRKTSISEKARTAFTGFKTRMSSLERIIQCKPYGLVAAPRPAAPKRIPTHPMIAALPEPSTSVAEPPKTSPSRPLTIASFVAGKESQCTTPVLPNSSRSNTAFDCKEEYTNSPPVSGNSAFSALEAAMEELSKTITPSGSPLGGADAVAPTQSREPIGDTAGTMENAEEIFSTLMIETSEMSHLVVASGSTARRARAERRPSYKTLLHLSGSSTEERNSDRVTLWLDHVEPPHSQDNSH